MKQKSKLVLVISLILVFAFMGIASEFNSDWGNVTISDVYYPNSEGGLIHAQLFVPQNASSSEPLPAILNMHGGSDYLQTVSNYSIELARRGYIVLSVDAYGSGNSDYISGAVASNSGAGKTSTSALKMDGGASLGIEQLLSYKFVDHKNIGLIGHSMGGTYIANAALDYADNVKAIMPWGSGSFVDKMKSTDSSEFKFSVGYINAKCDEMVVFATNAETSALMDDPQLKAFVGTDSTIESGKVYGNFDDGTARVIYTPNTTHIGNIICKDSIASLCSFFEMAMPTSVNIAPDNQVWMYKETFCVLGIIALLMFAISLSYAIADSKVFSAISPTQLTASVENKSWTKYLLLAICVAVPALTLHKVGLWLATKPATPFMPMNWANNLLWLAVINSAILFAVFLLWHFTYGKKHGSCPAAYGFKSSSEPHVWKLIIMSFVYSAIVIAAIYAVVNLCYALFKIDFRFWQFGIMPITIKRFAHILGYLIGFIFAFGVMNVVSIAFASIGENSSHVGVIKQYVLGWLIGAGGYTIILVIYYIGLKNTHFPPFFLPYAPFVNGHPNSLVFSMKTTVLVPTFTFISILNTALFRKTKNIYVGWFVAAIMAAMIMITTNAFAC